jgi:hypothetical protein
MYSHSDYEGDGAKGRWEAEPTIGVSLLNLLVVCRVKLLNLNTVLQSIVILTAKNLVADSFFGESYKQLSR